MGFAARSVSLMRYRVREEIKGPFWDAVDEGVRKCAFKALEAPGDEIGMGWTSIDDFTDNSFKAASYTRGNYVALSLRIDAVRVPPRVLEMQLKKESSKLREQLGVQRLSATHLRDLKDRLKESLKTQVFPSIRSVRHDLGHSQGGGLFRQPRGQSAGAIRGAFQEEFRSDFSSSVILSAGSGII